MLPPKTARALEAILARTVGVDEPGIAVGVLKHDPKHGRVLWRGARLVKSGISGTPVHTHAVSHLFHQQAIRLCAGDA